MRILHVTSTFLPDSQGGIEELVRQICINTISYGVESRVFTLSRDPMPEVILIDGIEVFRVKKSFEISIPKILSTSKN